MLYRDKTNIVGLEGREEKNYEEISRNEEGFGIGNDGSSWDDNACRLRRQ